MKTPQIRQTAITELVSSVVLIAAMGLFLSDFFIDWLRWAGVAYGVFGLAYNARTWWKYFCGTSVYAWNQVGWISPLEVAMCIQNVGTRFSLREISAHENQGSILVLTSISGRNFYLSRDHVASDDEWLQVCHQFAEIVV